MSSGDPLFFLHHAMLDRVWWVWQMQDPENQLNAIATADTTGMDRMIAEHGPQSKDGKVKRIFNEIAIDLRWTAPPAKLMDMTEALGRLGGILSYLCLIIFLFWLFSRSKFLGEERLDSRRGHVSAS